MLLHAFVLTIAIRFIASLILSAIPAGKDVFYLIEGVIDFLPIEKNKSVGVPKRSIKQHTICLHYLHFLRGLFGIVKITI